MKEEDVPAEAVEADVPEAVANGADKNGGGNKGKYDRPGNVKRPKAKKNEVNFRTILGELSYIIFSGIKLFFFVKIES